MLYYMYAIVIIIVTTTAAGVIVLVIVILVITVSRGDRPCSGLHLHLGHGTADRGGGGHHSGTLQGPQHELDQRAHCCRGQFHDLRCRTPLAPAMGGLPPRR